MEAVFVDLPNFYSHFLESGIAEPRLLRDYFLKWFDFDRLALELTNEASSVWVFHSSRRFGPRENRIEPPYLNDFIYLTPWDRGMLLICSQEMPILYQQFHPCVEGEKL